MRADARLVRMLEAVSRGEIEPANAALEIIKIKGIVGVPAIHLLEKIKAVMIDSEEISQDMQQGPNAERFVHGVTRWTAVLE